MKPLLLALLLALPSPAVNWRWLHRVSVVTLVGSSAADAATSWGGFEQNRLLASPNGRFGYRGLGIKIGITGGVLASQRAVLRGDGDTPRGRKVAAVVNLGASALFAGVAAHNSRLR